MFLIFLGETLAREANPSQESGIDRTKLQDRPNAFTETSFTQSEISRNRGQESHFNHSEQQQESRSLREHQRPNVTQANQVKADFKSPLKIHLINQMMEWSFYKKAVIYLKMYQAKSR